MNLRGILIGLFAAVSVVTNIAHASEERINALILTGQNNHAWRETTWVMEQALRKDPRFNIMIVTTPDQLQANDFLGIDIVISNWNQYGAPPGQSISTWSANLKEAYVQFVENGGGHFVMHAGSSSFPEWTEYQKICLATWGIGETSHHKPHTFTVTRSDAEHPITQGIESFQTFDELWIAPKVDADATILLTAYSTKASGGNDDTHPSLLVGTYGKGRCATLLLGHAEGTDNHFMDNPSFRRLLSRSIEWAACGTVTQRKNEDTD